VIVDDALVCCVIGAEEGQCDCGVISAEKGQCWPDGTAPPNRAFQTSAGHRNLLLRSETDPIRPAHAPTRSQPAQVPALTAGARCAHRSATESRTRAPMPCACPAAAPPPVHTDTERGYSLTSCKIDGSEQTCRSHAELQAGGGMGSIAAGADPPHAEGAKLDQAQILKSQIHSDLIYLMY
jgi:hypothetical protein